MSEAHAEHGHHVISDKVLLKTFGLLLILMVATIGAARLPFEGAQMFPGFKDIIMKYQAAWYLTNFVALGIAVWKTVLVISNFMGVKFASNLVKIYAVLGFVGFSLLYIMMFDYASRSWEPVRGWEKVNSTALQRDMDNDAGAPLKQYPGKEEGEKHGE